MSTARRGLWAGIAVALGVTLWRLLSTAPGVARDAIVTVHVGDVPRAFHLHVPAKVQQPAALVLDFHGLGSSALQHAQLSRFDELADREGFVVAHPEGYGAQASFNAGACCGDAMQRGLDDVGFARAIIAEVGKQVPIDRGRVFAAGFSNGAFLVHRLACELADEVAAVAMVAGGDVAKSCAPSRPVAVLAIHGTADGVVRYDGGGFASFPAIEQVVRAWAERDRCPDLAGEWGADKREVSYARGDTCCESYRACAEGAEVTICRVEGGGHTWPSGPAPAELGKTSVDFDATAEIWRFFTAHARR